jgi:hypothetical protein
MGKRLQLVLSGVVLLSACGGGGGDDDRGFLCPTNNPEPKITSSPPTQATVGQEYRYVAELSYSCLLLIVPGICGAPAEPVQLPPGAQVASRVVIWTPSASDANKNVPFTIQTPADLCGERARQSWTVSVSP